MNIHDAIERVKKKEPLFTALVMGLVPVESKELPTLGTDGEKLIYNQKFLDGLSDGEASAVVLHECLHCCFSHLWRRGKRIQEVWNISCDYAINTIVNESFPLPKGALLDEKFSGMSAEAIYDLLLKSAKKQAGQGWCDKEGWEGKGKGLGDKIKKALGKKPSDAQKRASMAAKWKRLFEKNILKQYGKLPDSIRRVVTKEYYVPQIDWTSLVQNLLSEDNADYSFSSPDRRYLEDDFMLPDMASMDRLRDIVFAYDTSGSIDDHMLTAFYLETLSLFSNFTSLVGWTAICDAELHSFKEIAPASGMEDFDFSGGGGTSFRPVFEEIERRGIRPRAVFYFTDTAGDFPQDPGYPVFWLVPSGQGGSVPFGQMINFDLK